MDGEGTWQWAAGIFFILGSGFFSATDAALSTLGEVRARQLVEAGGARARLLAIWVRHPERVNATLTIGATLVAAGMGALLAVHGAQGTPASLAWTTVAAAAALLVLGQLIPRVLGRRFPARTAVVSIPVVHVLYWLLWPLAAGLERASHFVSARLGHAAVQPAVTSDEIEYLIEMGTREGAFDEVREELLNSVLEFSDRVVKDIMVPRTRMAAIDVHAPPEELVRVVSENPYSRMPAYQGTVDNVVGVLLLRDLIPGLVRGARTLPLERFLKPPYYVPEQMKISRLLKEMQRRKVHLAIVVDEFGGVSGIVTLEDVIEEIVGEIQDEADFESAPVRAVRQGVYLADASVPLHDLEDFLNGEPDDGATAHEVRFPGDGDYGTLGGFLTATAGRVPPVGERVDWDGLSFTVRAGDERRVTRVEIARRAPEREAEAALPAAEGGG